ncbi:FAD-binding oxidoreductase [Amycolatopsis minnesotensis]|uniref:FAD-binding oxidoreductase n=1 Tax=Amycolatopsis minnesotensis TaxID=337894 RepID=A0ABN2S1U3_9PSEU
MAETTKNQIDALKVTGPVTGPGADGYDEERTGFQLLDPHRPEVLVGATNVDDVRAAVEFAAARGSRVAVQATGHGQIRALDGGVLITTRRMSGVEVDPAARTAWVEAGATWHQVIEAAAPHGLAPLSGSFPGVGAVSYTLGGGIGLLARKYGFAADHVRRIDLVTADGRLREVTETSDPDLFWALRGGGGNFGVVTGMEIGLVPVSRIYGGGLFFDVGQVPEILAGWHRWAADLPEEMTAAVAMLPFPDLPMVPEPLRGKHIAQVQIAYTGSAEDGERLLGPVRALGPVVHDTVREVPFTESGAVFDEPDRPHAYRSANLLVRDLDAPDMLTALTKAAGPSAPVMCVVGLRRLGGALARAPRIPNAVGHRDAGYSLGVLSPVEPGQQEAVRALHRDLLEPWSGQAMGRSLNFTYDELGADEIAAAFAPADHRRLTEIRARHDPRAMFHVNHPILVPHK